MRETISRNELTEYAYMTLGLHPIFILVKADRHKNVYYNNYYIKTIQENFKFCKEESCETSTLLLPKHDS